MIRIVKIDIKGNYKDKHHNLSLDIVCSIAIISDKKCVLCVCMCDSVRESTQRVRERERERESQTLSKRKTERERKTRLLLSEQ